MLSTNSNDVTSTAAITGGSSGPTFSKYHIRKFCDAAKRGDLEDLHYFLEHGMQVNNTSAVRLAANFLQAKAVKLLVAHKADVNIHHPIMHALNMIRMRYSSCFDLPAAYSGKSIVSDGLETIKLLIAFKANVNCGLEEETRLTPLGLACAVASHKLVKLLVNAKADLNTHSGCKPLVAAAKAALGKVPVVFSGIWEPCRTVRTLLAAKADPSWTDTLGKTSSALHCLLSGVQRYHRPLQPNFFKVTEILLVCIYRYCMHSEAIYCNVYLSSVCFCVGFFASLVSCLLVSVPY